MKIGYLEIDLEKLGLYLMIGVFLQLFICFWIWRANIDLYTLHPYVNNPKISLSLIKKRVMRLVYLCYFLLICVKWRVFLEKFKKCGEWINDI